MNKQNYLPTDAMWDEENEENGRSCKGQRSEICYCGSPDLGSWVDLGFMGVEDGAAPSILGSRRSLVDSAAVVVARLT